jgi:hypothetical protein
MGFQKQVNREPAFAVEGDFATSNPFASFPSPEGGLVAGPGGVIIGRFAFIQDDGVTVLNAMNSVNTVPYFVHRDQQGLITEFLQEASMVIPEGMPVTLMRSGDFYVKAFAPGVIPAPNRFVFASEIDGRAIFAPSDEPISGYQFTNFLCSRGTNSLGELAVISN